MDARDCGFNMVLTRDGVVNLLKSALWNANKNLRHFDIQLADGYWENSRGEFGTYGDGWYEDVWNCFEFGVEAINNIFYSRSNFVITLKEQPLCKEATNDCEAFHEMTDEEIVDYLKEALFASIDEAPLGIFGMNEYEWNVLEGCINEWEILPPPKPKLSHKELEKLVGYEFEYVK